MEDDLHARCRRFEAAMEIVARPWTGLIMVALDGGPLRFRELGDRVGAVGDRMLSLRLRDLEARSLVVRRVIPGPPVRVEYALTETGRGFRAVAMAIERWGGAILEANTAEPVAADAPREVLEGKRARQTPRTRSQEDERTGRKAFL